MKEHAPGLFAPAIDRSRCEGGYHHDCKTLGCPCVAACPYSVLAVRPLASQDKRAFNFHDRLRAWVHGNRQAYAVKADRCTACGECVRACPVKGVIKLRRSSAS